MMKHFHYKTLASTQDQMESLLDEHVDQDYLLVSSDEQTKGRGRQQKTWESLAGGIFISLLLPPANTITLTSLELSIHLCDFFGDNLKVKWPNDIFTAADKKCGGILIDIKQSRLIAGIGFNIQDSSNKLGSFGAINQGSSFESKEKLSYELANYIQNNRLADSLIIQKWSDYCLHLDADVEIEDGDKSTFGKFHGIGLNGQALIKNESGVNEFYTGSLKLIS